MSRFLAVFVPVGKPGKSGSKGELMVKIKEGSTVQSVMLSIVSHFQPPARHVPFLTEDYDQTIAVDLNELVRTALNWLDDQTTELDWEGADSVSGTARFKLAFVKAGSAGTAATCSATPAAAGSPKIAHTSANSWQPTLATAISKYASREPSGALHTKQGSQDGVHKPAWQAGYEACVATVLIKHTEVSEKDVRKALNKCALPCPAVNCLLPVAVSIHQ